MWRWTCFIPTKPVFKGILWPLCCTKLPMILSGSDCEYYSMTAEDIRDWSKLENDLNRFYQLLDRHVLLGQVCPVLPWVFGYKRKFRSFSQAFQAMERSQNWNIVWIGLISFTIAKAKMEESTRIKHPMIWPAFGQGWTSVYLTLLLNFWLPLSLLFRMLNILPRSSSCQTWKATRENMVKGLREELTIIHNNSGCPLHKRCGRSSIDKIRSRTLHSKLTTLGRHPTIERHVMFTNQLTHVMNRHTDSPKIGIHCRLGNSQT